MPAIDRRSALVLVVGVTFVTVGCMLIANRFYSDPGFLKPHDFLQYWAAGRLNATGGNPYDATQLNALQKAVGRPDHNPVIMWNPPWVLSLVMPVGLLPVRSAQLVWVTGQLICIVMAGIWLWRLFDGLTGKWWVGGAIAAMAPMTAANMIAGQSCGWLLLGLVSWLTAVVRNKRVLAGGIVLCAIKPHLFIPLWILLVLDATHSRAALKRLAWGMLAGGVVVATPLIVNPNVWQQYFVALNNPGSENHIPLSAWQPPLLGYWLRVWIDPTAFWIQFIPTIAAAVLTPLYWWRRRANWNWVNELPQVILVSTLTAPYGAWDYDLVILLVPAIAGGARLSHVARPLEVGISCISGIAFTSLASQIGISLYYVWMTPAIILWYGWAMQVCRKYAMDNAETQPC